MTGVAAISNIQREYFRLLADVLPRNVRDLIQTRDRTEMMVALIGEFAKPSLFTAYGTRQSSVEVALDEAARLVNKFWRDRAEPLRRALMDTRLYGVTLETQRFPSRLPQYLKRLALYFDCVGMVDLLHMPEEGSLERVLRDPRARQIKIQALLWLAWMVRASEAATIDPSLPVFIPLPNNFQDSRANSAMHDMAAQYLASQVPALTGIRSTDALDEFLLNHEEELDLSVCNSEVFRRLVSRFSDDEGVIVGGLNGEAARGRFETLRGRDRVSGVHHLVGTTFACARETALTALPIGWDPIYYDRNTFLQEWLFRQTAAAHMGACNFSGSQYEQTAVTALVGTDLDFLEAISIEDIRRVRETTSYRELRKALLLSRDDFKVAARVSPEAALRDFVANVHDTIQRFGIEYQTIVRRQKSARLKAGLSFAGAASLTALTFAFPASILVSGLAAGTGLLVGGKSVLDLVALEREGADRKRELEANPLMLLFKASLPAEV